MIDPMIETMSGGARAMWLMSDIQSVYCLAAVLLAVSMLA
jgi:hypothetical protein